MKLGADSRNIKWPVDEAGVEVKPVGLATFFKIRVICAESDDAPAVSLSRSESGADIGHAYCGDIRWASARRLNEAINDGLSGVGSHDAYGRLKYVEVALANHNAPAEWGPIEHPSAFLARMKSASQATVVDAGTETP